MKQEYACNLLRPCAQLLVVAALVAGCKQTEEKPEPKPPPAREMPAPAQVVEDVQISAKVVSVDPATRKIQLKIPDGGNIEVEAGPAVRNFDQIKVGDTVDVKYTQALAVAMLPPGQAAKPDSGMVVSGRAEAGARPAGGLAAGISMTVRIESVDPEGKSVVFTTATGERRSVRVLREEGRKFVRALKPGDQVEITYAEALAMSLQVK